MLQQNLKKEYRTRSITPSVIQSKRSIRIFYCRYADDWIILTNANRNFSNKIINLIETKLKNDLNLELNRKKTKILWLLRSQDQKRLSVDTRKLTQLCLRVSTRIKRSSNSYCLNYEQMVDKI
jgi:hypothetical protein